MKKLLCALPLFLFLAAAQTPALAQIAGPQLVSVTCTAVPDANPGDPDDCTAQTIVITGEASVSMSGICNNGMAPSVQLGLFAYNCSWPVTLTASAGLAVEYVFYPVPDPYGGLIYIPMSIEGVSTNGDAYYWESANDNELWYGYNDEYCNGDGDSYYGPPYAC